MSAPRLVIRHFAQIEEADLSFGDLTLLVGPQATGKSLVLQLLKLGVDGNRVTTALARHGFGWKNREEFCAVYFGEGLAHAWTDDTSVSFDGRPVTIPPRKKASGDPHLFYIPAHRTLSVAEGWPLGFRSYKPDTPYVVRDFSEQLLALITTARGSEGDVIFPAKRRLKLPIRRLIDESMFHGGELRLISDGPRKQFKIVYPQAEIAYMAWTAGQREFIPLLLGIYHLVPLGKDRKVDPVQWVVIEEPEMGLHSFAVLAVMLLILELMDRGYRVVLSTHSTTVVEVIWGFQRLKSSGADAVAVLEMFGIDRKRWDLTDLAAQSLRRTFKVHALEYDGEVVKAHDISSLDPDADSEHERTWGGLISLSGRVNKVVAGAALTS